MLTRKLTVALALAVISTGALAATSTGKTDVLDRPIVQTTPVDGFSPFDPARILWEDTHPAQSTDVTQPSAYNP